MGRIEWVRAAQFNWVLDNMGGAPLQEAVAGNWQEAVAQVQVDGQITLTAPNPGGGQVYFIRGVYRAETVFPWNGFWVEPMSGDLTNYYQGGSFSNRLGETLITLGTPLAAGTQVQLFYIYHTGEQAAKYEPLNDYPCIRRAVRTRDDYSYDFAVDRMLDLMTCLHLAGPAQGKDYRALIRFLWRAFISREESCQSPLMQDSFERQLWDRGAHLMYRGATSGGMFQVFHCEAAANQKGWALHVRAQLPATTDAAWFGYGLDWELGAAPLNGIDRLSFKVQGPATTRRVHDLAKTGSGSAVLVIQGDYTHQERRTFVVQVESSGAVSEATFKWSKDGGVTWEATGLISGDREHPVDLWAGLSVYWEGGSGLQLMAGDYWTFWAGEPAIHPLRLLIALNDSTPDLADPWDPAHTYVHSVPDRFDELASFEVPFSQFWRRDNLIDDVDRASTTWGAWYSVSQQELSDIFIDTREVTEVVEGETFYSQRQVTWDLSPNTTAFGVWAAIDPGRCDSSGQTQVNFLIRAVVTGVSSLTLHVKLKDAQGSYFYREVTVPTNVWQRVTVTLADLQLESGALPLTHPCQAIDLGIPASPPSNGAFYLTDLKFGEHRTFAGAARLRTVEFKMEQQGLEDHEWWLDEVSLNLEAPDPYPYAPRMAISLTPYGQNPWRGPTLVHYAQPLAPHLAGALELAQTYVSLHRDAQDEFNNRYGGLKGPIMPVHTRNDVENIPLCGCEDFGRFTWWPRYRHYGLVSGTWLFNEALTDASGHNHTLCWGSGNPAYTDGVCQPGATAVAFDGSAQANLASNALFEPGTAPFSLTLILRGLPQGAGYRWLVDKMGADGWVIQSKEAGSPDLQLKVTTSAGDSYADIPGVLDGDYHLLTWMVAPAEGRIYKVLDGTLLGSDNLAVGNGLLNTAYLNFGAGAVFDLDYFKYERRVLPAEEYQNTWGIVQGLVNGSAYPEVGCGLGQYWAFLRLAQYFFVTGDPPAWTPLDHWLAWLETYAAADGPGWQFPTWFSEYGFGYGAYDPGQTAAIALGCLYIHMRNGDLRAADLARMILDDLGANRWDLEYGGYQSDRHYGWLNGLVLQAFGVAVNGVAGQRYRFPTLASEQANFEALLAWIMANAGDDKPNVVNRDLIPFTYSEAGDLWDYAPHYLALGQMTTLEAVVLMLAGALEYGKLHGDWDWFNRLLAFMVADNLAALSQSQLRRVSAACDQAGAANLVRLRYADYDQDTSKYREARDQAAIEAWGEQAVDLDCRYGSPVILEDPAMAQLLAARLLQRLGPPVEAAEVETWLEGARIELGDTVAISSDFHGWDREEFTVLGKNLDLGQRRMHLKLSRPLDFVDAWAVEAAGSAWEAWALDQDSSYDGSWDFRAYVY